MKKVEKLVAGKKLCQLVLSTKLNRLSPEQRNAIKFVMEHGVEVKALHTIHQKWKTTIWVIQQQKEW